MSPERKNLKIVCFASFVVAVICAILGIVSLVNGDDLATSQPLGTVASALLVVAGVLGVALCARGIQGANTPRTAGKVRPVGIACGVAGLAAAGCSVAALPTAFGLAATVMLVLAAVATVWAGKVFEQAQR